MEPTTVTAALGAVSSIFGGGGGGQALPNSSGVYGAPVNVSVGGLNVPAFPDFPVNMLSAAGQSIAPVSISNKNTTLLIAGGLIVAAVLFKKFVK